MSKENEMSFTKDERQDIVFVKLHEVLEEERLERQRIMDKFSEEISNGYADIQKVRDKISEARKKLDRQEEELESEWDRRTDELIEKYKDNEHFKVTESKWPHDWQEPNINWKEVKNIPHLQSHNSKLILTECLRLRKHWNDRVRKVVEEGIAILNNKIHTDEKIQKFMKL